MGKGGGQGSGGGIDAALDSAVSTANSVGVSNGEYLREGYRSSDQSSGAYAGASSAQATRIATGKTAAPNTGHKIPPIKVTVDHGTVHVKDGRHRLADATKAGATRIRAVVTTYYRGRKYERETTVSIHGK